MSENAKNPLAAILHALASGGEEKPPAARPALGGRPTGLFGATGIRRAPGNPIAARPAKKPCVCPASALPGVRKR
jgi:hypothetical protein